MEYNSWYNKAMKSPIIKVISFMIFFSSPLYAENTFLRDLNAAKRSEVKSNSRWTLEGWLAQKEKNKMMDLWLAMNQPSPYESYLSFQSINLTQTQDQSDIGTEYTVYRGSLTAYAGFFGLESDYLNNTKLNRVETRLSLNLRLLGSSQQSTNLTLGYGQKLTSFKTEKSLRQMYLKGNLTVYLTKLFGIYGEILQYSPTSQSSLGDVSGYEQEVGIFIDYSFIRIFGVGYYNQQKFDKSATISKIRQKGLIAGFKIFF